MSIFKGDLPRLSWLWDKLGITYPKIKEMSASNIDHATVDTFYQNIYLDWYKGWEDRFYWKNNSQGSTNLQMVARENVIQIIRTINHVDMFSPAILQEISYLYHEGGLLIVKSKF